MTIERFDFKSRDIAKSNVEKIGELFPGVITEKMDENGVLKKAIDFDKLMAELRDDVVEKGKERYEFTWPGKRKAMAKANKSINKTLRPVVGESKDWDNTENLYIEGDNLEALKLLQESYLSKVKMIYIDPPYNTGNDFIYDDVFDIETEKYNEASVDYNGDGGRLVKNTDSKGRYHSDWCSMIYPRLKLARNLLTEDGVIFISIDDNEQDNLKKICDEVFGSGNFVGTINWKGRGGRQDSEFIAAVHEHIHVYSKNKNMFIAGEEVVSGDRYNKFDEDKNKHYKTQLLRKWGSNSLRSDRPNLFYPIKGPGNIEIYPIIYKDGNEIEGCWRWGKNKMMLALEEGLIEFIEVNGNVVPYEKIYQPTEGDNKTKKYITWIDDIPNGTNELKQIFNDKIFDYPKNTELIKKFIKFANVSTDSIILDFFSGSATTAHAVMDLNVEDGGKRKYIMVQLPEATEEKSEAYKAGYKNICEIGKERIRRAGDKILEDNKDEEGIEDLDTGFRVFRIDSTNMKDVYFTPDLYEQNFLLKLQSNIKEDRNDLDLLFACLLDWGLPIDRPYSVESVGSSNIHIYNHGDLVACFSENLSENIIKRIAKLKPLRVVFRDSSFGASEDKINVEEIFKVYSPETDIRVL